jgi:hypothetical protein
MKPRNPRRRGSILVMAIGLMILVEFLTVNQLESIKMSFNLSQHLDYQKASDLAARSGLDYGYAMLKNVMESMSLVDLRFATHMHNTNGTGRVAEVPPSWQEIINPVFDKKARDDYPTLQGNWVGTDSYNLATSSDEDYGSPDPDPDPPVDLSLAVPGSGSDGLGSINPNSFLTTNSAIQAVGFDYANNPGTLRECAEEPLDPDGTGALGLTTYTLHDPSFLGGECSYQADAQDGTLGNFTPVWTTMQTASSSPDVEAFEANYPRDGHFGTKRWHYYDQWNFSAVSGDNIASDIASSSARGTGGMIRFSPGNLSLFAGHRHIFFERLFNYRRNDTDLQYPYEPLKADETDAIEKEADQNAYHVQLQTVVGLDDLSFSTLGDQALFDHTDFQNIKYKVFFKLWITRDELRNAYNGELSNTVTRVTTAFITHGQNGNTNELLNWAGSAITADGEIQCGTNATTCSASCDVACDLHPLWAIPRETGVVAGTAVNITNSSYWRPNYLRDTLDTDNINAVSTNVTANTNHRLGVLQFPVPYLAYQRGDKDYWPESFAGTSYRGTTNTTLTTHMDGLKVDHPSYTRFTLWSLGTVREIKENGRAGSIAESDQKMNDFEIVARTLYKMDFYMDVRVADTNDESEYRNDNDIKDPAFSGDCSAGHQDYNNTAFFNARRVPACDVHPTGAGVKLFEPLGIYLASTEKVDYMDSVK